MSTVSTDSLNALIAKYKTVDFEVFKALKELRGARGALARVHDQRVYPMRFLKDKRKRFFKRHPQHLNECLVIHEDKKYVQRISPPTDLPPA